MIITADDPARPDIIDLLREHLQDMALHSPPESIHALDIDGLRDPRISFWSVREAGTLLGCCALKQLDPTHGEIKSMRTVTSRRRSGIAAFMVQHLLDQAVQRGYQRLSLETGSAEAFAPARRLYARFGFEYGPHFADYVEDPHSVFMSLRLPQTT